MQSIAVDLVVLVLLRVVTASPNLTPSISPGQKKGRPNQTPRILPGLSGEPPATQGKKPGRNGRAKVLKYDFGPNKGDTVADKKRALAVASEIKKGAKRRDERAHKRAGKTSKNRNGLPHSTVLERPYGRESTAPHILTVLEWPLGHESTTQRTCMYTRLEPFPLPSPLDQLTDNRRVSDANTSRGI